MSYVPQIKVSEVGNSLVVENVSGLYSPNDNPTGFGVQNIIPQWITTATLSVEALTSGKKTNPPIVVTGVMDMNEGRYQVLPWDIGGMKKIESEKYKVTYEVFGSYPDGSKFHFSTYRYFVTTHQVTCCVEKESAKTLNVPFDSVFRDDRSRSLAEWSILLKRAEDAIECGDLDSAERIVLYIRYKCQCNDCK